MQSSPLPGAGNTCAAKRPHTGPGDPPRVLHRLKPALTAVRKLSPADHAPGSQTPEAPRDQSHIQPLLAPAPRPCGAHTPSHPISDKFR